jgi:anti-sigma regulatory factor (Ser/Thr protein kinase)
LTDDRQAPGTARRMVARHLHPLPPVMRDDLTVMVSELVTNAVIHGRPEVLLHLFLTSGLVRVEVYDGGDPFPVARAESVPIDRTSGRGLAIVDSMATRWGVGAAAHVPGKSVWFELTVANAS